MSLKKDTPMLRRSPLPTLCSAGLGFALAACGSASSPGGGDDDGHTSINTLSASDTGTGGGEDATRTDGSGDASNGDASGTQGTDDASTTSDDTTTGDTSEDESSSSGSQVSATGNDDGPIPCQVAEATLTPVPPNIMLVLDKSRSMISNSWDHDADPGTPDVTRWFSLYQVVDFVVSTFNAQINFGANLFPSTQVMQTFQNYQEVCHVWNQPEIPVAPMNANAILNGIPGPNDDAIIWGATPAAAGFAVARDHLMSLDPNVPRAVVFIADGAANCMAGQTGTNLLWVYDTNLPAVVGAAYTELGLPTYVVGIDIEQNPTSNPGDPQGIIPYDEMNLVAQAGGRPRPGNEMFYQTLNQIELQAALQEIIDDTLSCVVPLNPAPAFPDLLEIHIGNTEVPRVTDCETEDGWVYSDPNPPYDSIELCGTWCGQLKSTGALKAEYYCNPG